MKASRIRLLGARATLAAVAATIGLGIAAAPSQAFNSRYCGGGSGSYWGVGNGCTSGAHTWGWNYVQVNNGFKDIQEYVYRELTGTGLSNRFNAYPNTFIESYNDLDSYYYAGYLQRATATNYGPNSALMYSYAQTCLRGTSC